MGVVVVACTYGRLFLLHSPKTSFLRQIPLACLVAAAIRAVFGVLVRAFVYSGVSLAPRGRTIGEELAFCRWLPTSVSVAAVASHIGTHGVIS